ncbi:MAG: class I SAM-dependent methyltransferase [Proteobacteria bacterium]|nr:class I SAM-dependent methyltransferase [Pseudomonadota bacterium]
MDDSTLDEKFIHQGDMLANRVKKKYKHLRKQFARENIEVFRLYDWDIPEIRAVVDWYAGHLVIGEYTRTQTVPEWLPAMGAAVAKALDVPPEMVHLKERRYGSRDGKRYKRLDYTDKKIVMSERDLKFYVNPDDYVDTGLFSDHRNTRMMVRDMAKGKDFLNLYCYTGAFTCYAAKGGARSTVSVDRSETAIAWVRENLRLNDIQDEGNTLFQEHTFAFLKKAKARDMRFNLAVVDPPSFSTTRVSGYDFDVVRDHPMLLTMVIELMTAGSTLFFSTNHQNFESNMGNLPVSGIKEITSETIPVDYESKKKTIHRCWEITI